MPEGTKESKPKSDVSDEVKDAGGEELQERYDAELKAGKWPADHESPIANKEYSLLTGPDSPNAEDARLAVAQREVDRGPRR